VLSRDSLCSRAEELGFATVRGFVLPPRSGDCGSGDDVGCGGSGGGGGCGGGGGGAGYHGGGGGGTLAAVGEVQASVVYSSIVCNAASFPFLFSTLPWRAILPLVCLHPRAPPPTGNVRYGNTAAMQLKKWRTTQSEDLLSVFIGSDEDAAADGGSVEARRAVLSTRAYLSIRLELFPVATS